MIRTVRGLELACHPGPSAAVTAFATALAVSAGLGAGRVVLVAVAFLTGQLSIGWLNDYIDRDLDARAQRADKPLTSGAVTPRAVRTAIVVAAAGCVVTSLALGVVPGLLNLLAVASAYSYDLALKWSVASWAPFALSFGLLPCVVTTARPGHPFPPPLIWLAGAALGVAAHLANTVKDVDADALTGVRGFPQRLGPRRSLVLAAGLVGFAGVALVVADPDNAGSGGCAGAAVVVALFAGLGPRRKAFASMVLAAGLVVAGVVISGGALGT
jgi:4-hydroxybenzoate polyprenyltransferase